MGVVKLVENEAINDIQEWFDAYVSSSKKRGSIGLIQWEKARERNSNITREKRIWISRKNLNELIKASQGHPTRLINAYVTLNAFKTINGKGERKTANLAQIRNVGVDIDCYTVNLSVVQALSHIQDLIVQCEIPNPNLVIRSGNGLQLVYSIEGGAPPTLSWLTSYITSQFIAKTSFLGSDGSCTDVTRVFRLPGSLNVKPGKTSKLASVEIWRKREYDLSELYAYCEPLKHRKERVSKPHLYPLPKLTDMGHKLRSLNLSRINDIYKLIDLRGGNIEKRNVLLYDFSYLFGLQTDIESAVVQQASRMNDSLDSPLSVFEVERVAKNAFKDARTFWKAYLDNGYRMPQPRTSDGLIRPKKNATMIDQHNITAAEMKELSTIIDDEEKKARRTAKRRAAGMKTIQEHNNQQKLQKADRMALLAELKANNPKATQKQLAELMGISLRSVKTYLKELQQ